MDTRSGPLQGIAVLDLTSTISGPYCTLLLAQLGARVDKIEPLSGDVLRRVSAGRHPEMSPLHLAFNAGKQSVQLELSDPEERALLHRALPDYDVVVHNMRPAAAARLGLTPEGLEAVGAEAVLCEISGFGPGPLEGRPAYDDTIQAASGMAWVQGNGGTPSYVRTPIADKTAGLYAALAICAELAGRARGAHPRSVQVPMLETLAAFTTLEQLGGYTFSPPTGPGLYERTASVNRRPFATADGYLSVLPYTDRHWESFLAEAGSPERAGTSIFRDLATRNAHIDEVYAFVAEVLPRRSTEEWVAAFERADVPCARVNAVGDLLDDVHLGAVGMFPLRTHPSEGSIRTARAPFLFDRVPLSDTSFAEPLGASTNRFRARYAAPHDSAGENEGARRGEGD